MSFNYILPDTPELILDENAVDVFELTIGSLTYGVAGVVDNLVDLAWAKYGRRPIGDYDYEYWMESLNDEVKLAWEWYEPALTAYLAGLTDLNDSIITVDEDITRAIDEVDANTTTNTGTDNVVDTNTAGTVVVAGTSSSTTTYNESIPYTSTVTTENEIHPDTAAGVTKYVDSRGTTTTTDTNNHTGTVGVTGSTNNTTTNTEASTHNNTKNLTTGYSGTKGTDELVNRLTTTNSTMKLKAENFNVMVLETKKASMVFIDSLDKLFMHRW